ncbi:ABC transporter permease, partial [Paenibacillus sepulcri]|nr:ABC transporter permease [Paenibacillus sepulcri]
IAVLVGRLRTFAEDADVLFLLQRKEWGRSLTLRGMGYTAVILSILTVLIYAFLLPFLITLHGLTMSSVVSLAVFTLIWSMIGAIWRNLIEGRYRGWRKWLWKLLSTIILGATYVIPVIIFGADWLQLLLPIALGAVFLLALMRL